MNAISHLVIARNYVVPTHQERLAMPGMRVKMAAQVSGLGVGWLTLENVRQRLAKGKLVGLTFSQSETCSNQLTSDH